MHTTLFSVGAALAFISVLALTLVQIRPNAGSPWEWPMLLVRCLLFGWVFTLAKYGMYAFFG